MYPTPRRPSHGSVAVTPKALARQAYMKAYNRAYRAANKEALQAHSRAYNIANPSAISAKNRDHYAKNRVAIASRVKAYRATNYGIYAAYQRAYHTAHREVVSARLQAYRQTEQGRLSAVASTGKRRASKRGTSVGPIDWSQVWDVFDGNCGICRQPLQRGVDQVHMDHIVPLCRGGAHVTTNLQVTHAVCNLQKGRS